MKVDVKMLGIAVLLMVLGGIAAIYAKDAAIRGAGAVMATAIASMITPWLRRNVFPSTAPPPISSATTTLPAPPPVPTDLAHITHEENKS